MRDKSLKNLIKKIEQESSQSKMAEIFEVEDQKELADFVRIVGSVKNHIEPDRSLLLKILNDISDTKTEKNNAPNTVINRAGFQLKINKWLKFSVPVALVVLAAIFIWQNPFSSERSQVAEIKSITVEEKAADQANKSLKNYIAGEKQSAQLSQSTVGSTSSTSTSNGTSTPFDGVAIISEAGSLNFDPGLAQFIAQEKSMSTVDATLSSF